MNSDCAAARGPHAIGCAVLARDGRELGRVSEVSSTGLKVVADGSEYWIDVSSVERISETALILSADVVKTTSGAGIEPEEECVDFEARPAFTRDDERRQREHMEAELREQAQSLAPSAIHPMHKVPGAAPTDAPEPDRTRGETLRFEQLLEHPVLSADGEKIGVIRDVVLDESTLRPEWLSLQAGSFLAGRRALAPVFGSYVLGDEISVPYTRDQVLASPVRPDELTPEARRALREHYGLVEAGGRAAA